MKTLKQYIESAFTYIEELFGIHHPHPHDPILEQGEVTVSGKGCLDIPLHHKPKHVYVHFMDHCDQIPCNPVYSDSICYEAQEHYAMSGLHKTSWVLHIEYDCHGTRGLRWTTVE